jgi:hypothetical protein
MDRELAPVATDRELLSLARRTLDPADRPRVIAAVALCKELYVRLQEWGAAVPDFNRQVLDEEILQYHNESAVH